jgi:hypothetical protein
VRIFVAQIVMLINLLATTQVVGQQVTPPDPVSEAGVTTVSGMFEFDRGTRQARYRMDYSFNPPIPAGTVLRSEFENPLPGEPPLVVQTTAEESLDSYEVRSPPLPAIQNGGTYEVILIGLDGNANAELFRHVQPMRFRLPPEALESR